MFDHVKRDVLHSLKYQFKETLSKKIYVLDFLTNSVFGKASQHTSMISLCGKEFKCIPKCKAAFHCLNNFI